MSKFTSEKVFDGFSTCFRQWKADGTHCQFLHGYGVSFKVVFEGALDGRNWVWDFGGMKRAKTQINGMQPEQFFKWLLDHTVIIALDDPEIATFVALDDAKIIQLRTIESTGCERFAEYLYTIINNFIQVETSGRVSVKSVTFIENKKNSATYSK